MQDDSVSTTTSSSTTQPMNLVQPPLLGRTATYLVGGSSGDSPPSFLDHLTANDIHKNDNNTDTLNHDTQYKYTRSDMYGGSRKGAKTFQEDSYITFHSANNKVIIGGVMDGHGGYNGMIASQTARDTLNDYFNKNSSMCEQWDVDTWKYNLDRLFEYMHNTIRNKFIEHNSAHGHTEQRHIDDKGIVRTSNNDPVHGGTTCTIVVMIKNNNNSATIITANVGDSTALLLPMYKQQYNNNKKNLINYHFLSVDHGPENTDEFHRIKSMNLSTHLLLVYDKTSVIRKFECPHVFNNDGSKDEQYIVNPWGNGLHPTNVRYEPAVYAVTPRNVTRDSTCIAMTRALGDFYAHQFGLTYKPNISVRNIEIKNNNDILDYMLIVGSDGVWDCWRYEDFSDYTTSTYHKRNNNIQYAGEQVLDESIHRAIQNFGQKHYDDAALVMWKFPT